MKPCRYQLSCKQCRSRSASLEYFMTVKLLTEHHLEFISLKGVCTGSSESTLVKIPHCWKSHVMAQLCCRAHLIESCQGQDEMPLNVAIHISTCNVYLDKKNLQGQKKTTF